MIALVMMMATAASACMAPAVPSQTKWLTGDFSVTPVVQQLQRRILQRLGSRSFKPVPLPLSLAKTLTGEKIIRGRAYLVKVGWYSPAPAGTLPGANVKTSVNVDASRTAYITSFLLTHAKQRSEFAAVLTSSIPLRHVVRVCEAAE